MAFQPLYLSPLLAVFLALTCFFVMGSFGQEQSSKLYIVHMGAKQHQLDADLVTASHHDVLTSVIGGKKDALSSLVYSYRHGFSGFAAKLTDSQAKKIAELSEVASVKPSRRYQLHTTRSWDFLGVNPTSSTGSLMEKANHGGGGEDVIIGIIDTGIWPESPSFSDTGYSSIPSRWKGICQSGQAFGPGNCNRKIVGARWYNKGAVDAKDPLVGEYLSPRDSNGHGTHTASTAAGSLVRNVSYHGLGAGMARGGAPRARIAVYKVCWGESGCSEVDVLKAMEDAVQDGVDVMSLSIGGDGYAPASLHAITKGIPVVFSAGNDGPAPQTVENEIPWAISVAASTMDRSFPTLVTLGNKQTFLGQSIFYELNKKHKFTEIADGASCDVDTLNATDVRGKVVLCYPANAYETVPRADLPIALSNVVVAGGRGLIFLQSSTVNILENLEACRGIPCVLVDLEIAHKLSKYMNSASMPMVKVTQTVNVVGAQVLAPMVAAFSSRGPSSLFPAILKPDITAPGVSVLAATGSAGYGFMSGTSMSCPHVSGVVALLKSLHPDWSPAVIKSALVTTASAVDGYGQPIEAESTPRKLADPFDFGGGHINPNRAADPGLVYDIGAKDYLKFFDCTFGASGSCNESADPLYHLNLPSIVIPDLKNTSRSVWRTVTNVGSAANVTYKLAVESPPGVDVVVKPRILRFSDARKVHKFKVSFTSARRVQGVHTFGSITWSDGNTHSVRIPIAVRVVIWDSYADTA